MDNERSSNINIGGETYELILTTKATKEIMWQKARSHTCLIA